MAQGSAERQQVTGIFVGLFDSTTPSLISAAQRQIAEVVHFLDGIVAKNLNDGVLAYFGYPQVYEDHAERAVLAAVQAISAVASIRAPPSLQARVGIATGMAAADDLIGSGVNDVFTEARNLAARQPESTEPNTVVIAVAESTLKLLGNPLKFEDIRTKDLKGVALEQIAEIAKVPPERRTALRIEIVNLMINFIRLHQGLHDPKLHTEMSDQLKVWKTNLMRVVKARRLMGEAALELKSAIEKFDESYGEADRCTVVAPQPIDRLLSEFQEWVSSAPPIAAIRANESKRRGRPSRPTHAHFHDFLCGLLGIVKDEGGKLTFDKNYPTRGTLVRVLDLLRPHMPREFIPENLPVRVLISAQKIGSGGFVALEASLSGDLSCFSNLRVLEKIVEWWMARSGTENTGK
jgi:class 3 adenylate cyclase